MKNPFLDTHKYAIVRQYSRLQAASRSSSKTSRSSADFSHSYHHYFKQSQIPSPSFKSSQIEYGNTTTHRYQIQQKNAKIYGLQQLRYKPAYFDELNPQRELSKKYIHHQQYPTRKSTLMTQKSNKLLKSTRELKSIKYLTNKMITQKDQIDENKENQPVLKKMESIDYLSQENSRRNPPSRRRKSSIMETLIHIGDFQNGKNQNQFFQSFHDLELRKRMTSLQPRLDEQIIRKRSSSNTSQSYSQNAVKREIQKKSLARWQSGSASQSGSSSYRSESEVQDKNQLPESILIRGRLYFKYDRPN